MNLNNDRNILLAKKGIYAEQLYFYSKLCTSYQALAEDAEKHSKFTSTDIERKYGEPLSKIIASDNIEDTLEELSKERIFSENYIGSKYSKRELEHFKKFAQAAKVFKCFKTAEEFLDDIENAPDSKSRKIAIDDFHSYLKHSNRPKTVQNFDELISVHSPRYLGSRFFLLAKKGIDNIDSVDQTHIPLDPFTINKGLSPEKFGATINGCRSIYDTAKDIIGKISDSDESSKNVSHFDPYNWNMIYNIEQKSDEARDEFSSLENSVKESAFVAKSKVQRTEKNIANVASRVYTAHKGTLKKAVIIAAAVASLIGGSNQAIKEIKANNLDINSSTQYEQTVSQSTKDYINSIMEQLNLQKNAFDPQYSDAKNIEENIDLVLDYIVKDQVTSAFEEYHTDYTVTDVQTWFNKKYSGTADEPRDYRFIDVFYKDADGNEGKETISNFRSEFLLQNPLNSIFELEETIDLDSPIYKAFSDDGTKNFVEKAQDIEEVMEYLEKAVGVAKHTAAFELEHGHSWLGDPYLKAKLPDEIDDKIDDEER